MEGEDSMLVNGGDAVSTASDYAASISNGFPSEKSQTLTPEENEEELETPKGSDGSDDTIKLLHQEIQDLRRDRSELQHRMEEILCEIERSEVGTKAISAHASYLEGELLRTQEDLGATSAAAEHYETEVKGLHAAVKALEADVASIASSKADLKDEITAKEADLAVEKEKVAITVSEKEAEILALKKEVEALKEELRLSKEKGEEALEEEMKRRVSREEELEKAVKEMKERNSELEGKIDGLLSKIDRDVAIQKSREVELATVKGSKVLRAEAAGAAVLTATVAVAVTAFYLRRQR